MQSLFNKIGKGIELLLEASFKTILACLQSRKFVVTLAGLIVVGLANYGIILSPDDVTQIIILFSTLIGGQSIVDYRSAGLSVETERLKNENLKLEIERLNLLKETNKNV